MTNSRTNSIFGIPDVSGVSWGRFQKRKIARVGWAACTCEAQHEWRSMNRCVTGGPIRREGAISSRWIWRTGNPIYWFGILKIVDYIHFNPVKHGWVARIQRCISETLGFTSSAQPTRAAQGEGKRNAKRIENWSTVMAMHTRRLAIPIQVWLLPSPRGESL